MSGPVFSSLASFSSLPSASSRLQFSIFLLDNLLLGSNHFNSLLVHSNHSNNVAVIWDQIKVKLNSTFAHRRPSPTSTRIPFVFLLVTSILKPQWGWNNYCPKYDIKVTEKWRTLVVAVKKRPLPLAITLFILTLEQNRKMSFDFVPVLQISFYFCSVRVESELWAEDKSRER